MHRLPLPRSLLGVVILTLGAAACGSTSRFAGSSGRAVVVWEPAREADAEVVRATLGRLGWSVSAAPAGPARRTRSSVAIYGQRHHAGRGTDLAEAIRPVAGEIETLPFLTDGPGLHDAVVWLAEAGGR